MSREQSIERKGRSIESCRKGKERKRKMGEGSRRNKVGGDGIKVNKERKKRKRINERIEMEE